MIVRILSEGQWEVDGAAEGTLDRLNELDAEVEWHSAVLSSLGGEATVHRGHDGVREMFGDLYEAFDEIQIDVSEIRDLGDRLVAIGRTRTRGKVSGVETETPLAFAAGCKPPAAVIAAGQKL